MLVRTAYPHEQPACPHALCACNPNASMSQPLSTCRLIIGPVSSIFDVAMFLVLWNFFRHDKPSYYNTISFQTGWFLESLLSQVGHCAMVCAMGCSPCECFCLGFFGSSHKGTILPQAGGGARCSLTMLFHACRLLLYTCFGQNTYHSSKVARAGPCLSCPLSQAQLALRYATFPVSQCQCCCTLFWCLRKICS